MASDTMSGHTLVASERVEAGKRHSYHTQASDFVELHDQVQTSVNLLDSLESFLSTFQKDLSAVSGQISELQERSKDIDSRLRSRRKIEKPLSSLISDITVSPTLTTMILDSPVGEAWIAGIEDFERRLVTCKARSRVKAARDLAEVFEGLRIVAATKLRAYFLALFQPIRNSVTTNMQVIQTSVLLKYQPLFAFLHRQAPNVAQDVQRSYVAIARLYYETGFRRYARSLGYIKTRSSDKSELLTAPTNEKDTRTDLKRLASSKIEGPPVTLAYMADDKTHKEPIEALFRALLLVLMDNSTAEYTFLTKFLTSSPTSFPPSGESVGSLSSPALLTPDGAGFPDSRSVSGSDFGGKMSRTRADSLVSTPGDRSSKEEQVNADSAWKQILDPVLEYCQTFVRSALEPIPPVVSLLTMIRLAEDVVTEVQKRKCPPLESFVFGIRLQMWPVFQKAMSENVEALKKLAEGANAGYFSRSTTTDTLITSICQRYIILFNSFVYLTDQPEETMIFSNLARLRQELTKLITRHTERTIPDQLLRASTQSTIFEGLLQGLRTSMQTSTHRKAQQEISYWAGKEAEARGRIGQGRHR